MNYRKVNDKYIVNKNGVYITLTESEVQEMKAIIADIESGDGKLIVEDARKAK